MTQIPISHVVSHPSSSSCEYEESSESFTTLSSTLISVLLCSILTETDEICLAGCPDSRLGTKIDASLTPQKRPIRQHMSRSSTMSPPPDRAVRYQVPSAGDNGGACEISFPSLCQTVTGSINGNVACVCPGRAQQVLTWVSGG